MIGAQVDGLTGCRRCPRLVRYIASLPPRKGRTKKEYWSGPVPGFGDPKARICLVGLAPGAHGANRTGRPFTGDGAGDFMYPLLHQAGLSNQAEAVRLEDGLVLRDLYISNAVKCVPPENKPKPGEFECCRGYLAEELSSLPDLRVVILLGQGAFTSVLRLWKAQGLVGRLSDCRFAHGAAYRFDGAPWLLASYHTSRYNVQTGRMTREMFLELLARAKTLAAGENG